MEKIKELLASIGLGKNEAEIYTALMEMGTSSVLNISKKTKIHRSNIYDALRNLLERGFIYEIDSETKLFSAKPPESILNYLKQKELELNELIKEHQLRIHSNKNESKVRVSKGLYAFKEGIYRLLETGQPIRVYGIPNDASERLGPILKEFHAERIKKKILMQQIYNSGAVERVKYLNKMKFTEARVLPAKYDSFATTNITGDRTMILLWDNGMTVIEITDESMARPYKNYFDILWSKAKTE